VSEGSEFGSSAAGGVAQGPGGEEIALNMPRRSAHDIYLIKAYNTLAKFDGILFSMQSYTDVRIVPYTRQCITIVLDDAIQDKLFKALNHALDYIKTARGIDATMKGDLQIEVCQKVIGQINLYLDEFIGLSKTNALIPLSSVPNPEEVAAAKEILAREGDIPDETVNTDETAKVVDAPGLTSEQDQSGGDIVGGADYDQQ
jgi:hypothetical protein